MAKFWHSTLQALPPRFIVLLAWCLSLALAAWLAAGWFWHWTQNASPSAHPLNEADPQIAAREITTRQLFGVPAPPPVSAPVAEALPPPSFTLTGVQTRWGQLAAFAILREGSISRSVLEGEEISPGVTLTRVLKESIQIRRNGQIETIALSGLRAEGPAPGLSEPPPAQSFPITSTTSPQAANTPPTVQATITEVAAKLNGQFNRAGKSGAAATSNNPPSAAPENNN